MKSEEIVEVGSGRSMKELVGYIQYEERQGASGVF